MMWLELMGSEAAASPGASRNIHMFADVESAGPVSRFVLSVCGPPQCVWGGLHIGLDPVRHVSVILIILSEDAMRT